MTPAERAVIEAARELTRVVRYSRCTREDCISAAVHLDEKLAVMDAERKAAEDTRPWRQVVAEDEIYSTKTSKWYRVVETHMAGGMVMMRTDGMAKAKAMDPDAEVKVRRSEMGQAVDVWAGIEVISS